MNEIAYWHWILLGVVLITIEIFTPIMLTLWFGLAAIAVGIVSYFFLLPITLSIALWLLLSIVMVILWFYLVKPTMARRNSMHSKDAIVNQKASVISVQQGENPGIIRFYRPFAGSDEWLFCSDEDVKFGDTVVVIACLQDNVLKVKKFN